MLRVHCYIKEKYQQRSTDRKIFFEERLQMKELFQNEQSDWVENLLTNERHSGRVGICFSPQIFQSTIYQMIIALL